MINSNNPFWKVSNLKLSSWSPRTQLNPYKDQPNHLLRMYKPHKCNPSKCNPRKINNPANLTWCLNLCSSSCKSRCYCSSSSNCSSKLYKSSNRSFVNRNSSSKSSKLCQWLFRVCYKMIYVHLKWLKTFEFRLKKDNKTNHISQNREKRGDRKSKDNNICPGNKAKTT